MHSRKLLELLLVGLSAITVAEATFIDSLRLAGNNGAIQRRQEDDEPSALTSSLPTSSPPPTTAPSSPSSPSPTRTSSPPTTAPSSTPTRPTSSPTPPPTSADPPPKTSEPPKTEPPKSDIVETITSVITSTDSNGVPTLVTTTSTQTPGLASGNVSQPSGMSKQTRDTVIGVVVGVGGAIVLGALAFVAWRIWGRKKGPEENDGLMDYGSNTGEKPESGGSMTGRTPFQSTLESYHAPTQVNTASNF